MRNSLSCFRFNMRLFYFRQYVVVFIRRLNYYAYLFYLIHVKFNVKSRYAAYLYISALNACTSGLLM